ncbi:unnamed protein product [Peronospora farinosa]|uniref:JmjC domain-containing protein n=1 Tax=Peronospora farinosa TaxID=134698 RepID=A0AAV0STD7_9STRA|nr:unnamed protein product [Peronospora farinosa]
MSTLKTAHIRFTTFLRRQAWDFRHVQSNWPSFVRLILFGLGVLTLGLWVFPLHRTKFHGSNALRWGVNNDVVILTGQNLQRSLPLGYIYPNGASNKFQCDLPALRHQCELDRVDGCKGYPQLFPSAALFDNWNPENTAQIPQAIFDSICHFNVSDSYELRLAQMFREMDVPFVAYGVPELMAAAERWTDDYLTKQLNPKTLYNVNVANGSHYMYATKKNQLTGEKPTYESRRMTYPQFVKALNDVKLLHEAGEPHKYYYLMLGKNDFMKNAAFVYEELQFLNPSLSEHDPRFGDLFIRDIAVAKEKGMRCRLGMRGIIAEGHYDNDLNYVSIIRGTKRYVISPPSACKCQGLITQGQSARHTSYNWSDINALPEDARNCPAAEVALTAGEVLYIPSLWYHHIVSIDTSIQCNLRSGGKVRDEANSFIRECMKS